MKKNLYLQSRGGIANLGLEDQRGINMVDLMMWLVIAALLLAAALQGIGFYQRAAWNYQLKNDTTNVRNFMEAQRATNGVYPDQNVVNAGIAAGTLNLTDNNSVAGVFLPADENWVVRVCSESIKIATNNSMGSAIRINRADPRVFEAAVCN